MKKLLALAVATVPFIINWGSIVVTNISIHNNYSAPISYAVDSTPKEAIQQFNHVKTWMENNHLTKGNTCIFIKTNPYCELSNFYSNRIITSINESDNVTDPVAISNLSLKLNERFIGKGSEGVEYVKKPTNLNLYMRWRNLSWLGWWFDLLGWMFLIAIWFFISILPN
jgi:hypothetical protein